MQISIKDYSFIIHEGKDMDTQNYSINMYFKKILFVNRIVRKYIIEPNINELHNIFGMWGIQLDIKLDVFYTEQQSTIYKTNILSNYKIKSNNEINTWIPIKLNRYDFKQLL